MVGTTIKYLLNQAVTNTTNDIMVSGSGFLKNLSNINNMGRTNPNI